VQQNAAITKLESTDHRQRPALLANALPANTCHRGSISGVAGVESHIWSVLDEIAYTSYTFAIVAARAPSSLWIARS
jgi:hypothetical protein